MRKSVLFFGLVLGALPLLPEAKPPSAPPLLLHHITVIDATGASPRPDMTVLIEGERIIKITKTIADRKSGAEEVDGTGKFLIPGLWDMHVHLAGVSADPKWSKDTLLPLLLGSGITGIRDMGGDLDALLLWKKEIDEGSLLGPRLVVAGPMLELARVGSPEVIIVRTAEDGRKAVDDLSARGVDFIKVLSRLSRESFLAIATEARAKGLPLAGHVPAALAASEASAAGMKSIEHIFYSNLAFDCSSREKELREKLAAARAARDETAVAAAHDQAAASFSKEKADALWKSFRSNKTWVVPTLAAMEAASHLDRVSPDDPGMAYIPSKLRAEWSPEQLAKDNSPGQLQFMNRQFENDKKIAREMHRAGVKMLAGSDSLDTHYFPGASLHRELALLVDVGFTPMEALQAATRGPAEFLGRREQSGTVEKGKIANLVLLDANPLENIAHTVQIAGIVLGGKYLSRADLEKMLVRARAVAKEN